MSTPWLKIVTTTSVGGYVLSDGGSEGTTVGMCCACNTAPLIAASPSNIMNKSLISILTLFALTSLAIGLWWK